MDTIENNAQSFVKGRAQQVKKLASLNIRKKKTIIDFDEAGFKVGCMKGHEILVPQDITKVGFIIEIIVDVIIIC